jgi:hypothetical protein
MDYRLREETGSGALKASVSSGVGVTPDRIVSAALRAYSDDDVETMN